MGWPRGLGPASPVGTGTARYVSRCPPGLGTGSSLVHPGLRRRSQIWPRGGRGRSCPSAERPRAPKGPRGASRCWGRSVFSAGIAPNPASKRLNGNISPLASRGRPGSAGKRARKEGGRGEKGEFGFLSVPSLRQKKPFFSPKLPPAEQSEVTRWRARGRTAPSDLRTGPGNRPRGSES